MEISTQIAQAKSSISNWGNSSCNTLLRVAKVIIKNPQYTNVVTHNIKRKERRCFSFLKTSYKKKMFNSLVEMLQRAAEFSEKEEGKVTFIDDNGTEKALRYNELNDEAIRLAYSLMDYGIKKGDRILFQFASIEHYVKIFWACMYCGAVPMKLIFSKGTSGNSLVFQKQMKICEKVSNLYLFTENEYCNEYKDLLKKKTNVKVLGFEDIESRKVDYDKYTLPKIEEYDDALVLYSSGSTNLSKGVLHTQRSAIESVVRCIERNKHNEQDRMLSFLPITHAFGFFGFHLMPIACCCDHYLMPASLFIKKPADYLRMVEKYKLTVLSGMNFALEIFIKSIDEKTIQGMNLSTVKHYYIAGEPVNADVIQAFLNVFKQAGFSENAIRPLYGMSEGGLGLTMAGYDKKYRVDYLDREIFYKNGYAQIVTDEAEAIKFVSMGRPIDGLEVRVMNEDREILKDNEIGELYFKGKSLFKKYMNIEDEEEKNLVDGFLGSGDMGYISGGEVVVTGRKKDIIFVNGQNYFPLDIEVLIGQINKELKSNIVVMQVFDFCNNPHNIVFIKYNKTIEEFVDLVCVLKQELKKYIAITFDAFIPIDELPRTGTGKLKRTDLQKGYVEGMFDNLIDEVNQLMKAKATQHEDVASDNLSKKVIEVWDSICLTNKAKETSDFEELGADSLIMIQFIYKINEGMGINIKMDEMMHVASIQEAVEVVRKTINEKDEATECYLKN